MLLNATTPRSDLVVTPRDQSRGIGPGSRQSGSNKGFCLSWVWRWSTAPHRSWGKHSRVTWKIFWASGTRFLSCRAELLKALLARTGTFCRQSKTNVPDEEICFHLSWTETKTTRFKRSRVTSKYKWINVPLLKLLWLVETKKHKGVILLYTYLRFHILPCRFVFVVNVSLCWWKEKTTLTRVLFCLQINSRCDFKKKSSSECSDFKVTYIFLPLHKTERFRFTLIFYSYSTKNRIR